MELLSQLSSPFSIGVLSSGKPWAPHFMYKLKQVSCAPKMECIYSDMKQYLVINDVINNNNKVDLIKEHISLSHPLALQISINRVV